MIRAQSLAKSYGKKRVLQEVTFRCEPGQVTLLVGANGAGKSTIMRILSGLARADSGEAFIGERSLTRERIGAQSILTFLPQTPDFHPGFTPRQLLTFYARLRGLDPKRAVDPALEIAGLDEVGAQPVRTLSGGMRQRLGLAILLLPGAPVLLLDEPGISLDSDWRRRMQTILLEQAAQGKTVLITTHLLAEWNDVAHRCLVCREGTMGRELDPARLTDAVSLDALPEPRPQGNNANPLATH